MNYNDLIHYIQLEQRIDYWEQLICSRSAILQQLNTRPQAIVAKELKLSQPQLSTVAKLLRAMN